MGIAEADLDAAENQIDVTAAAEELTPEEINEFMDNLFELTGTDTIADLWDALFSEGGEEMEGTLAGMAADQAKGEVVDAILERVSQETAEAISDALGAYDAAGKIVDAALMAMEQYQKDKQKWENRAAAAVADRTLRDFYGKLNEKLREIKDSQPTGWVLSIQASDNNYFSFFGIAGNMETWTVNMSLQKFDKSSEDEGPSGTYRGVAYFSVEYEMSSFDNGFKDLYVERYRSDIDKNIEKAGMTIEYGDDFTPSKITRTIIVDDCSIDITASSLIHGESTQPLTIGSFSDDKTISISHNITFDVDYTGNGGAVNMDVTISCAAQDTEGITISDGTMTGKAIDYESGYTIPLNGTGIGTTMEWDPSIWEIWDKDKKVTITMP